ncbi:MAG: prepilin peptidase [Clostridia bacterium]
MLVFLNIFVVFCIFVIGTLFGSFFSLATYRLPRHQDIVATRSYCTSCKHRLGFFDLIPILSFVIRGGKCKYCGSQISPRYILLELSNGIVFVLLYFIFGYTFTLLVVCLVYAVIFTIAGSLIMKSKMSEEEKVELNKKKLSKKSGVFLSELVVAMIMFTLFLVSSYIMSLNYQKKSIINIAKSNAIAIATKNIEVSLATKYDLLDSSTTSEKMDNITYMVSTSVSKYCDEDLSKEDIVKKVNVKVEYMVDGKPKEFSLDTLKGKV